MAAVRTTQSTVTAPVSSFAKDLNALESVILSSFCEVAYIMLMPGLEAALSILLAALPFGVHYGSAPIMVRFGQFLNRT